MRPLTPHTRCALAAMLAALTTTAACSGDDDSDAAGGDTTLAATTAADVSGTTEGEPATSRATTSEPAPTTAEPATTEAEPDTTEAAPTKPKAGEGPAAVAGRLGSIGVDLGDKRLPFRRIGVDQRPEAWIAQFGIDGFVFPTGNGSDLLYVIAHGAERTGGRTASLYFEVASELGRKQVVAAFERAVGGGGTYEFERETSSEDQVEWSFLTATGTSDRGTDGAYEISVGQQRGLRDQYSLLVTRTWGPGDISVPKRLSGDLRGPIAAVDAAGMAQASWRYYQGVDIEAINRGERVIEEQINYGFDTPSADADANADRLAAEIGAVTKHKTARNGNVTFRAMGGSWIFNAPGGGGLQINRVLSRS